MNSKIHDPIGEHEGEHLNVFFGGVGFAKEKFFFACFAVANIVKLVEQTRYLLNLETMWRIYLLLLRRFFFTFDWLLLFAH